MRLLALLALNVLLIGCGGGVGALDDAGADAGADAGVTTDAGVDAAVADAARDSGVDARLPLDAGIPMSCAPAGDCDPFGPDPCPLGEVCVLGPSGLTRCRLATSAAELGEPCARAEDCLPGLLCVNVAGVSSCHRACAAGSVGACAGEERCIGSIGHDCVRFCRARPRPCDIYRQDCPDPGDSCTFAVDPETGEHYTGCRAAGSRRHGESCGADDRCVAGYVCIRRDGAAACHEVCDPMATEDTCTTAGEVCEGVSSTWRVGYCRPPVL